MLPMFPRITDARPVRKHQISDTVHAVLLTDIVTAPGLPPGLFTHILVVFRVGEDEPVLFVTAEKNARPDPELLREMGFEEEAADVPEAEPVYFLCAFDRLGRENMGYDEDWSDLERFEQAALKLVDDYAARGELDGTPLH